MTKQPRQIPTRPALTREQIDTAAYVGSSEHKTERWWGGLPAAFVGDDGFASRPKKRSTTICPLVGSADRDRASNWVRQALIAGRFRYYEGDKSFPKKLWHKDEGGRIWFGYCVNSVLGHYKGWPVDEDEKVEVFGAMEG
ncbi:MAG: hypothetical protein ACLPN5_20380 [Roseiarcus sp.]